MNLGDFLTLTVRSLVNRPVRSFLTLIGIFIGVMAVVALMSLGRGLDEAVKEEFAKSGGDKIIIQAKGAGFGAADTLSGGRLTRHDMDIVKRVNGVSKAAGILFRPVSLSFNKRVQVQYSASIPSDDTAELAVEAFGIELDKGRLLRSSDRGKALVGASLASKKDYFGKIISVGDSVLVNNTPLRVIGVLKAKGDPGLDQGVVLVEDDLRPLLDAGKDDLTFIYVRASKGSDPEAVAPRILHALARFRSEKEGFESVEVQTLTEVLQSFASIFAIVQAVLVGIALISFVVGAVGIMNTMYTSVAERTPEIGIMKAVGATNAHIACLFFLESGLLGFLGGALGAGMGAAVSKTIEVLAGTSFGSPLIKAVFPPELILGAVGAATVIGALAGLFPALLAARQRPIEALRYE